MVNFRQSRPETKPLFTVFKTLKWPVLTVLANLNVIKTGYDTFLPFYLNLNVNETVLKRQNAVAASLKHGINVSNVPKLSKRLF